MKSAIREIELKEGMKVSMSGHTITLSSQDKSVSRDLGKEKIKVEIQDQKIMISTIKNTRRENALLNTLQKHLQNLVQGLEKIFEYKMTIVYSHFPMTVTVKEKWVEINNFTGEKKTRKSRILPGAQVEVKGKDVIVRGHNKEAVGQTAANLENVTKVKGKDTRVYQDGIYIVSKPK
ncbi:50S ribosomal protein L6 [Candidatus Micrarchaeota archaeon]|nr:50S ribosomal protein L6 [Candidatus Micrarchaeota archaeon]MBU1930746.1 50S ribosomal protein L6 [Candidatus Micrarchaeota archaeon]